MLRRPIPILCAGLLTLLLAACGSGDDAPEIAPPLSTAAGVWVRLAPQAAQIDGELLTPTCSKAPGSKADFHFWAKRGTVNKLVVFFEGGGACWDSGTCSFPITATTPAGVPALYKAEILPTDNPTTYGGIFTADDARNPVKDWTQVYVPYCTGDIHGGSKTASYNHAVTGQAYQIEHRGADNFRLILEWMRQNITPEQVLVTGSSAGAYGAVVHYPRVRATWPQATSAMLGDAGQGVVSGSFDAARTSNWNFQLDGGVYGANAQTIPSAELVRRLAARFPGDRFAQYTTASDLVQMQFYDIMANGLTGTQGTACTAWTNGMLAGLTENQKGANFRSYMAAGTTHTLLRGRSQGAAGVPLFFEEASAGVPFTTWMAGLVGAAGGSWDNRACTNCTTLPACPF